MNAVATGLWQVRLGTPFTERRPTGPWLQRLRFYLTRSSVSAPVRAAAWLAILPYRA
jgi:hypothetical protein